MAPAAMASGSREVGTGRACPMPVRFARWHGGGPWGCGGSGWRSSSLAPLVACSSDDPSADPTTTTRRRDGEHHDDHHPAARVDTARAPARPRWPVGTGRASPATTTSWIFTTNNAIYRAGAGFVETQSLIPAIPEALAAQGYNHIGDGDVVDDVLWVPLERDDKESGEQATARFDATTFAFIDSFPVAQHHNSFVTVDDDGVVWSTDEFSDDTLLRYTVDGTTVRAARAAEDGPGHRAHPGRRTWPTGPSGWPPTTTRTASTGSTSRPGRSPISGRWATAPRARARASTPPTCRRACCTCSSPTRPSSRCTWSISVSEREAG